MLGNCYKMVGTGYFRKRHKNPLFEERRGDVEKD